MPRRLADLEPKLAGTTARGVLTFLCPYPGHTHKLRVPVTSGPHGMLDGVRHWHAEGAFPDSLSLTPSVDADSWTRSPERQNPQPCWHGSVTNGEVSPGDPPPPCIACGQRPSVIDGICADCAWSEGYHPPESAR